MNRGGDCYFLMLALFLEFDFIIVVCRVLLWACECVYVEALEVSQCSMRMIGFC